MTRSTTLTRNLVWLYAGDLVAKVLTLAAFVALWRHLGPERMGDLEFAIAVWFVLNLMQDAGLEIYGGREAAKRPEETAGLAGTVIALRGALVLMALCVLAAVVAWLPHPPFDKPQSAQLVVALYALVLIPAPLVLNWVFQARDEMNVVSVSSMVRQAVLAGGVFLFVRAPQDGWMVPVADALGIAAVAVLHQVLFRRRVGAITFSGAIARARSVARVAAPLAASAFVWALRIYAPLMALYVYADSRATGVYSAGFRLVLSAHVLVWLYFFNLLPSISRASMEVDRGTYRRLVRGSLRFVAWTVLPGCAVASFLAPWVIPFLGGARYAAGIDPFRVQVWMLAAAFLSGHMRFALIAFDRQTDEFWASLAGALVAGAACAVVGEGLTPLAAAVIFAAAETTTFVVANSRLSRRVEPIGLAALAWRPALATLAGIAAALPLADRPFAAAAACLGTCAVGLLALDRGAVVEARGLLAGLRGR